MPPVLVIILAFPLWIDAGHQEARQDDCSQEAIDAAIDRGVSHLLELYGDGEGRDLPLGQPRLTLLDHPGLRALTIYALMKSGVEPGHVVVERLVASLAFQRFDKTYDAACMLLALTALDPFSQRPWIDELAADLLSWQEQAGDWGYPEGGDLSNTQYAALALRAAAAVGVEVAPEVWADLARAVLGYRTRDGGFAYVAGGKKSTGSMTTAGVGTLALCEIELARAGALDPELEAELRRARAGGLAWLAEHFTVVSNPGHKAWTYYYLYGLERVGALAGIDRVGDRDWYQEGATFLVGRQGGDGVWAGTFERVPTLFALLFLRRATESRTARAPETPAVRPRPVGAAATHAGALRLRAEGRRPVRLWIEGWSADEIADLEWPGEEGRGPRVLRVEYLADGEPIAAALGYPERPAEGRLFGCEYLLLARGRHRLRARVHIRPPPVDGDGAGVGEHVLVSNEVELEVEDDAPARVVAERGSGLLGAAGPKAKASSVFAGAPEWGAGGFRARLAVDGNPRSPWIADPGEDEPTLRITLKRKQRADIVRVEPARLVPRMPDFLTLPSEIAIRINRGPFRTVTFSAGPRGRAELRLDEPVVVQTLELRIVAREVPGAAVGIGEVELLLSEE